MPIDPRHSEKAIAPSIAEEIDGRSVYSYKLNRHLQLNLGSQFFEVGKQRNAIIPLSLFLPLSTIINYNITAGILLNSDKASELEWAVLVNNKIVSSGLEKVSAGATSLQIPFTVESGINLIHLDFVTNGEALLSGELNIVCDLDFHRQSIMASDLGVDKLFVEEITLDKGDVLGFDSLGNIFTNQNETPRIIKFNKPVAVRIIYFLAGSPEVLFYHLHLNGV